MQILSQRHGSHDDLAHHLQWQEVLAPAEELSDDIALAYEELRRSSRALARLRER